MQPRINIPTVTSKCPTCETPNPSLSTCSQCNASTMCSMCESARVCAICRDRVKRGEMVIEQDDSQDKDVSKEEKHEAMKTAYDVLSKLNGAVPILVPPLKALTKLSESDFDELMGSIRGK